MPKMTMTLALAALLATIAAPPLPAQTEPGQPDPLIATALAAAGYFKDMFTKAAEQMSEEDYAFKPTPQVRSFGQLLAHVADSNNFFCATVKGEPPPASGVEKTKTTKADIQQALSESFAYCDGVYAAMTDAKSRAMVDFMGEPRPALGVLLFRTHHAALHYGNAITYIRLRGQVPPAQPRPEE